MRFHTLWVAQGQSHEAQVGNVHTLDTAGHIADNPTG